VIGSRSMRMWSKQYGSYMYDQLSCEGKKVDKAAISMWEVIVLDGRRVEER